MNQPPPAASMPAQRENEFRIVWTLGFAGKRLLPDPEQARRAVRAELASLLAAARREHARLVAVSSLAIGADLLFAEECIDAGVPWRMILPFAAEEFLKDDFSPEDEARFRRCAALACATEIAPIDAASVRRTPDLADAGEHEAARKGAYLDADYRVVEQADVVLLVWDGTRGGVGGSADAWNYAATLGKPVWCWNPATGREERHRWPGVPGQGREAGILFRARMLSELFAASAALPDGEPVATDTASQAAVRAQFHRLDRLALREQERTKSGLQRVLTLHLAATVAAGISFTFLNSLHPTLSLLGALILLVSWAKPVCAYLALRHEDELHHDRRQARWVDTRVAAELCRSMLTTWALPSQPENIFDPEDFPRFRRLIHSLLTARLLDYPAVAEKWTLEAACAGYVEHRLKSQAEFFEKMRAAALEQHRTWHRLFVGATGYVIFGGGFIAALHTGILPLHLSDGLRHTFECLLIVSPFAATYALAMQTIHDTRRRLARFAAMAHYLREQITGIARSRSSVARLRLIAAGERMLIEELHEWDSVTRHITV